MSSMITSLFASCCGARKPAHPQSPSQEPPAYRPSETTSLLSEPSSKPQDKYQKWLTRRYEEWQSSKSKQDFETWLEARLEERESLDAALGTRPRSAPSRHQRRPAGSRRSVNIQG